MVEGEVEVYLDEKETYPLVPKKVLEFDGEARISVKALKRKWYFCISSCKKIKIKLRPPKIFKEPI